MPPKPQANYPALRTAVKETLPKLNKAVDNISDSLQTIIDRLQTLERTSDAEPNGWDNKKMAWAVEKLTKDVERFWTVAGKAKMQLEWGGEVLVSVCDMED